jgi:hypothetical protein
VEEISSRALIQRLQQGQSPATGLSVDSVRSLGDGPGGRSRAEN